MRFKNDIASNVITPVRVRFKYMLGEWMIGQWWVTFLPLSQESPTDSQDWPVLDELPISALPENVVGYQLRRTAVDRFPRGLSRQGDWICYSPHQESLYFVRLFGSFDAYLQLRSAKSRQNLKRAVKRFVERNPDGFEIYTQPESMAEFHGAAVAISRKTYQSFMFDAGLPEGSDYLRVMQDRALYGEARGYLLRENNKPIAFAWCTGKGDAITYQVIGYLSDYASSSPGTVLLYLIIQDLFGLNKYRVFDFGSGSAFYKESFATDKIEFADGYLLRPGLGNYVKLWMLILVEYVSCRIGKILDEIGLKRNIKKLMRWANGRK
ncbi:MAG: GNAT family N-acetyltransferase [Proteobacteria bacterium]|nr:GNAT family N-acetyltransferase [Pseudomonadota bacterium]MBS0492962.1 GNAT family N-acetyltransferase [Pseudomonadota bacterium]